MRQILQDLRAGDIQVADAPAPVCTACSLVIQSTRTLISAGTERMLVEFGKASLLAKARSQPDKVKQVLDKIKTEGLLPTLDAVFKRLNEPLPLGYCNAGVVLEVGQGVEGFAPGDRVASNGSHAEVVCVPKNHCAKIPDTVSDEHAAFTVLSSVGLQGVRLLEPALGERFAVYGLGLIGLVCVQLLRASGCEVLGIDVNEDRLRLAEAWGVQTVNVAKGGDPVAAAAAWTEGKGVDGVLIAASAKTDEILHSSAQMCRKRGRIVLVGVVGLDLRRSDFYNKELTFQVSCSYGPGRYDENYERRGLDYPYGFVRWTEQRNFRAILEAMAGGKLDVGGMITHHFPLSEAEQAYEKVSHDENALGVMLEYPSDASRASTIQVAERTHAAENQACIGVIGAGNFSKMTLMPALSKTPARLAYIADLDPAAARHVATTFGVEKATTDYKVMLADPDVNAVMIPVPPNLHARLVVEALQAGKHVFVEKPLAINVQEVAQVLAAAAEQPDRMIAVGFNRRFSPHAVKIKQALAARSGSLCMNMLVNAGYIPPESWVQDPNVGGGRIIGEGCHFIDLMVFLSGSKVRAVSAAMVGKGPAVRDDKMSISLEFEDGSVGSVNYFANGSKSYPKERIQVFSDERILDLDNFRVTRGYGFQGLRKFKTSRLDKGHAAEFAAFVDSVAAGGKAMIPLDELVNVTLASFAAVKAATESRTIVLDDEYAELLKA